ncbi:hypothetical protein V1523DRAFT_449707 [Lipomyces doorenjongii]
MPTNVFSGQVVHEQVSPAQYDWRDLQTRIWRAQIQSLFQGPNPYSKVDSPGHLRRTRVSYGPQWIATHRALEGFNEASSVTGRSYPRRCPVQRHARSQQSRSHVPSGSESRTEQHEVTDDSADASAPGPRKYSGRLGQINRPVSERITVGNRSNDGPSQSHTQSRQTLVGPMSCNGVHSVIRVARYSRNVTAELQLLCGIITAPNFPPAYPASSFTQPERLATSTRSDDAATRISIAWSR